ncbi:TIGR03619 family F420-dependent LLM class oxidoreductase [Actinomadura sp. WMMB 499]|uniref:TIGR03619 family F420-dependent LLM class oxidoreductase n=1 Tax=Actinomadura sp. WMMB 499 TaxID=1219491 RepID=UPI001247DF16|nr:TIGR03619 family F420-dependent LLM class oxidoreductase [Actinomadura sp. WMMB 499]QFG23477.1 TIGR03619 family F420-dependent LLM class oxidoreductase [Actinomadura sp. WMMB 499]
MDLPRIGVTLQHFGPHAGPDGIVTVARAAERLGFDAVSVSDRLLVPVGPHWTNDAGLPDDTPWDALEVLTWAAAHTRRIRVGTGVLNSIFESPVALARRLATLDRLSRGRLYVGIGQGGGTRLPPHYIPEEFVAAGVSPGRRGAGFAEHVAAMRACWGPDPVEFHGEHYRVPAAKVGPKPWRGRIPLLFGATARPAIERAARIGDGFVTVAVDWDDTRTQVGWYRAAGGTGSVVVNVIPAPPGTDVPAADFTAAALANLDRAAALGADEVHVVTALLGVSPERQVELLEALAAELGLPAGRP